MSPIATSSMLAVIIAAWPASAAEWPPVDPRQIQATVVFDQTWAGEQRSAVDFAELQRRAGALGHIEAFDLQAPFPRVRYGWVGAGGNGRMQVFLYADGAFAAVISPADETAEITLNSFGAFICRSCNPPVSACGRRPSWVPHDVHWDVFDCERTLIGPMTETH